MPETKKPVGLYTAAINNETIFPLTPNFKNNAQIKSDISKLVSTPVAASVTSVPLVTSVTPKPAVNTTALSVTSVKPTVITAPAVVTTVEPVKYEELVDKYNKVEKRFPKIKDWKIKTLFKDDTKKNKDMWGEYASEVKPIVCEKFVKLLENFIEISLPRQPRLIWQELNSRRPKKHSLRLRLILSSMPLK